MKERTRKEIIEVAADLFRKNWFITKTSMDEIAKTANKAKGSLYYHSCKQGRVVYHTFVSADVLKGAENRRNIGQKVRFQNKRTFKPPG